MEEAFQKGFYFKKIRIILAQFNWKIKTLKPFCIDHSQDQSSYLKNHITHQSGHTNHENQRLLASKIYQALLKVAKNPTKIENIKNQLLMQGFSLVEYLEIRNSCNLSLIDPTAIHLQKQPTRVFIAVVLEGVRLIDNFLIDN